MGEIVAVYDLMPGSTEIDLNKIVEALPSVVPNGVKVIETNIKPVAFGMMKINAGFVIDDSVESIGSILEEKLSQIDGIENVECVSTTVL